MFTNNDIKKRMGYWFTMVLGAGGIYFYAVRKIDREALFILVIGSLLTLNVLYLKTKLTTPLQLQTFNRVIAGSLLIGVIAILAAKSTYTVICIMVVLLAAATVAHVFVSDIVKRK